MRILAVVLLALLLWSPVLPVWAAITYVGGQTGGFLGTVSTTTVNFALTGGLAGVPAAGDIVIASYCVAGAADVALTITDSTPTDYTLAGAELYANDSNDTNLRTAYKVMGGTPDTSLILGSTTDVANAATYSVHVFRGQHATQFDVAVVGGTAIDTHMANVGSITPVTSGAVVYAVGCGGSAGNDGAVFTSSDLTAFLSTFQSDSFDMAIGSGYFAWTSGAFDPTVFAGGGTDAAFDSHAWNIIALAPAAASSTCTGSLMLMGVGGC